MRTTENGHPSVRNENPDGLGSRPHTVFALRSRSTHDYWASVTAIPCPLPECDGTVQWAEAGYVPGYRICDKCGHHFLASGTVDRPELVLMRGRRS